MERAGKGSVVSIVQGLLCSKELYRYVLDTSIYPHEPKLLKEFRDVTASHPRARISTAPDAGQMIAMLLKMINAKRTIEIGIFTGYSLLLTTLNIPEDDKVTVIDLDCSTYEMGQPIIRKAGVEHKIEFIQSEALLVLEMLLKNAENERSFDFAFVDADKVNYWNYHERLMKLLKFGGVVVYDNTLRRVLVAMPKSSSRGQETGPGYIHQIQQSRGRRSSCLKYAMPHLAMASHL